MELICPAGTPAAFREAVDAGADAVYCGFQDETNARNFPGLNFSRAELEKAIAYARSKGTQTFVAVNTFMRVGNESIWYAAVDDAFERGADAVIVADLGLMSYVRQQHPHRRLHASVQASASNADAIRFLVEAFGVRRVVLPRILTIPEIALLAPQVSCELEVFVFGGLCVMAEGRCSLSSYATGRSPNMDGVCSPASHVGYREDGSELVSSLGTFTINKFPAGEPAGYPTLCKGRFHVADVDAYAFEDPVSLDVMDHVDELRKAGVRALKVEGRQRGKAYVAQVVSSLRRALDAPVHQREGLLQGLRQLSEGQKTTSGAYEKRWR